MESALRNLPAAALVALVSCAAFAQQPAFPGVPVKAVVSVEPRHGKEVPKVRAEDIIVRQGKERDKVVSFQPLSEVGQQIFVLIDDSLSSADIGTQLPDIASFINSLPANTLVGVAYGRNGTAIVSEQPTRDHAQAAKSLRLPLGD